MQGASNGLLAWSPMKTVRIYGAAQNIREAPTRTPEEQHIEVWLSNNPTIMSLRCPRVLNDWTRWFNLHSRQFILGTYPSGYSYYQTKANGRPIYLQLPQPDIGTSVAFPRKDIQVTFATSKGPNRYFTCTVTWLIALAILEGFNRIELWGFELRNTNPGSVYAYERPCFFYWVQQARDRGIDVFYQQAVQRLPFLPGDPDSYDGKLYGYSTKPEVGWNMETEEFDATQE